MTDECSFLDDTSRVTTEWEEDMLTIENLHDLQNLLLDVNHNYLEEYCLTAGTVSN